MQLKIECRARLEIHLFALVFLTLSRYLQRKRSTNMYALIALAAVFGLFALFNLIDMGRLD